MEKGDKLLYITYQPIPNSDTVGADNINFIMIISKGEFLKDDFLAINESSRRKNRINTTFT
ncbi:hypothetical protein HZS_5489 [Henneguya salminicola]|nr:hypothetical protein HZS_5489 [Henneguya salminicola]